jgi:RNA polymerase sigma factor (TIGR02999 family)
MTNVTQLLVAWGRGDEQALNALMPEVQRELHRIAERYMAGERQGHDLQATALINEAYLRLVDWKDIQWADRAHFFAMAANMMRRVLVDHARRRDRFKRGGEAIHVSLVDAASVPAQEPDCRNALLRRLEPGRDRRSAQRVGGDRAPRLGSRAGLAVKRAEEGAAYLRGARRARTGNHAAREGYSKRC